MYIRLADSIFVAFVLASISQGRAVPQCIGEDCDLTSVRSSSTIHLPGITASLNSPAVETSLLGNGLGRLSHPILPRIEPIIVPKPKPEPEEPKDPLVPTDPINPGSTSPKDPSEDPGDACNNAPGTDIKKRCGADPDPNTEMTPAPDSPADSETHDDDESMGDDLDTDDNVSDADPADNIPDAGQIDPKAGLDMFGLLKAARNPPISSVRTLLATRIKERTADEAIPDVDEVNTKYKVEGDHTLNINNILVNDRSVPAAEGIYSKAGIDVPAAADDEVQTPGKTFKIKSVKIPDGVKANEQDNTYEITLSNDGKLGFADVSYREHDGTTDGRIPWYKMFMHILTHRNGDVEPSKLEAIHRVAIENESTMATINSIYKGMGAEDGEWLKLDASAQPESDEGLAFDAMCRTDNGKGTLILLAKYHQAFGDKIVSQIWLRNPSPDDEVYYMLMVLGS